MKIQGLKIMSNMEITMSSPDASWPELALYHYVGLARFYSG
jgi:hypothetical protein